MSKNKGILVFVLLAALSLFFPRNIYAADLYVGTPTVSEIITEPADAEKILVKGLTPKNTEVLIYINGTFVDMAQNYASTPEQDEYSIELDNGDLATSTLLLMAIARDKTSLRLSAPSKEIEIIQAEEKIPAPTLVDPVIGKTIISAKPLITGLTITDSLVNVYIDGKLDGNTAIVSHQSGTANFAYKPSVELLAGSHILYVVAEDKFGRTSQASKLIDFKISYPTPAPILLQTIQNTANLNRPIITGLTRNNTTVKMFIDGNESGLIKIANDKSETANFANILDKDLTKGKHFVYTIAYDGSGKKSAKSNILYFETGSDSKPQISNIAVEEKKEEDNTNIPQNEEATNDVTTDMDEPITTDSNTPELDEIEADKAQEMPDEDIKNILGGEEDVATSTGVINEAKKSQTKPQKNLVIFILFLIAVVCWIFWVNRELIKERREQENEQTDNEQADKK